MFKKLVLVTGLLMLALPVRAATCPYTAPVFTSWTVDNYYTASVWPGTWCVEGPNAFLNPANEMETFFESYSIHGFGGSNPTLVTVATDPTDLDSYTWGGDRIGVDGCHKACYSTLSSAPIPDSPNKPSWCVTNSAFPNDCIGRPLEGSAFNIKDSVGVSSGDVLSTVGCVATTRGSQCTKN